MIAKSKTSTNSGTFGKAGDKAEKQMAYYLDREFGANPNVHLFHDLRMEHGDVAAQIDHLVLHRYGMIIVESKSVTSKVRINKHGEWIRCWRGRDKGMPSPVQQAKQQGELLARLLDVNAEQLLGKVVGIIQARFGSFPLQVLVAISDDGIIERRGVDLPEVLKADQICDRIISEVTRHKRGRLTLGLGDGNYGSRKLKPGETERVVAFLLERHTPLKPEPVAAAKMPDAGVPPPSKQPQASNTSAVLPSAPMSHKPMACKHCNGTNIIATDGRYGYYLKCRDCDKNTPIDYTCAACGKKGRIRKRKLKFDRVCKACSHEEHVWTNGSGE